MYVPMLYYGYMFIVCVPVRGRKQMQIAVSEKDIIKHLLYLSNRDHMIKHNFDMSNLLMTARKPSILPGYE